MRESEGVRLQIKISTETGRRRGGEGGCGLKRSGKRWGGGCFLQQKSRRGSISQQIPNTRPQHQALETRQRTDLHVHGED